MHPLSLALALALLICSACPGSAQKLGGTLRIYHRDTPPSASIHEEATITTVATFMGVFNNLVLFEQSTPLEGPASIVPDLAESWSWDAGKTKLTFNLRQGVTWHDGKPFTARDVLCTWNRLTGKDEDEFRKNPRAIWWRNLKEVLRNGDHEVTFVLSRQQPSFLLLFASGYSPIYPCHVSSKDMRTNPIGTGPFKFVGFRRGESVRVVRNPEYWKKGRPYLDGIEWRVIDSRSTRILAFVAGEFDMTFPADVTIPLLKDLTSQAPKAVCEVAPRYVMTNLIVNREIAPFSDPKIRKAMALSLDRQSFVDILSAGKADIGGVMLPAPEGAWGMPPDVLKTLPGYSNDVGNSRAQGRSLMEEVGYSAANPLRVKISTRNLPTYRDPASILIDQLKTIHIDSELELIDTSIWQARMTRKEYRVGLNNTGVGLDDPDVNLYENYSCDSERNYTQYCNKDVDALIDKQSQEIDTEKRRTIVWDIERKLAEDLARPIIYHDRSATCWQPHVKGFVLHHNGTYSNWRFEDVWLDK